MPLTNGYGSFAVNPDLHETAGENGLDIQFARTDPRKYSFELRSVEHWNKLPEKVSPSGAGSKDMMRVSGHIRRMRGQYG
jgi:hypothetical protein